MEERMIMQGRLADKAAVAQSTLSLILNGHRLMGASVAVRLARALDLPLDYFLEDGP